MPLFEHKPPTGDGAGGAEDGQAERAGELHRRQSDPAAGAMNQDTFAGNRLSPIKQRAMRRGIRNAQHRAC